MATRRHYKRSTSKRSVPYDMNNINNWYAEQFRTKLAEWNIYAPSSYSKSELKSLYLENLSQRSGPEYVQNSDTALPVGEVTGRFGPIPFRTPGRFGPIPFRSGRFGLGHFGPISGLGRFGPTLAGRFGPLYLIWIFKC